MFQSNSNFRLILLVIIAGLFYLAGQYLGSAPQRVAEQTAADRELTVTGTADLTAPPDVATINLGVTTGTQPTAAIALDQLTQKFNAVAAAVRDSKVKEEDIKTTDFSLNPVYDYSRGEQKLVGFAANETINIKIRELDQVGAIIERATSQGANQVGQISFTIDEPEKLELEAQQQAIDQAKDKAKTLARNLNVHLGPVKSFSANNATPPPPFYAAESLKAVGMGGDASVPNIAPGSSTITANVTITYLLQ